MNKLGTLILLLVVVAVPATALADPYGTSSAESGSLGSISWRHSRHVCPPTPCERLNVPERLLANRPDVFVDAHMRCGLKRP